MKRNTNQLIPDARRQGLLVQELSDEVLVYDRERNKAHCLNRTAALVWNRCDGTRSVEEIAFAIAEEINTPVDEDLVWLGVEQLGKANLLHQRTGMPELSSGLSRREVIRRIGLTAAIALPVVTSIVAPTASQAANCRTAGQSCTTGPQCCSTICNAGICT